MYDLSVIVPTHNRQSYLPGLLKSLAEQDYPPTRWELIVVDDGSTDSTREYLELANCPRPHYTTCLYQRAQGAPAARNAGARRATGRALVFLGDDMIVAPSFVTEHARVHLADRLAVVVGHRTGPAEGRKPWTAWDDGQLARNHADLSSGRRVPGPRDFFSGNCSVALALFNKVGGYDADLMHTEDLELGYRLAGAGARFYYRPAASLHLGQHEYDAWVRRARIYGKADVTLGWAYGHVELQSEVFRWFHQRPLLIRQLVRRCSATPVLEQPLLAVLQGAGRAAYRLRARLVAQGAYSAIYNLAYWMALINELGREPFWAGVAAPRLVERAARPARNSRVQPTTGGGR